MEEEEEEEGEGGKRQLRWSSEKVWPYLAGNFPSFPFPSSFTLTVEGGWRVEGEGEEGGGGGLTLKRSGVRGHLQYDREHRICIHVSNTVCIPLRERSRDLSCDMSCDLLLELLPQLIQFLQHHRELQQQICQRSV